MEETREWMEETELENGPGAEESTQEEVQEAPEESGTATDRVWARLSEELTELHRDGWTIAQLTALAADEEVRSALAGGETLRRAAEAYGRRRENGKEVTEETEQETAERRGRKRGVPALRTATTGSVPEWNAIAQMNGNDFAKFSDDVYQRLMAGEKIAL
ncbi:MAG: hypothetical protein IJ381_08015 [Clostridia bacterium]|nr:hypothetical protein [Clostridia bacterium]